MIQQMAWLGLVVKDMQAATEFYTGQVGLEVDAAESVPGFYTQFKLNGGGATLALLNDIDDGLVEQPFDTALIVADAEAAYRQMEAAGVEIVGGLRDMPFGRTFLFRTPDGYALRILQPPVAG